MLRPLVLALALSALAGCGPTAPAPSSAPPAATSALTPEEITRALALLPAPYAQADYDAGRRVFGQCRSCHTIDGPNADRAGPHLHGIVGRHAGRAAGFTYSDALQHADFVWDPNHLDAWITNPRTYLPGNRMAFIGVRDQTQRRDLIAFLMVEGAR